MGGYHDERFHISSEPFFLPVALEGEGEAGLRQNIFQFFGGVIGVKAPECIALLAGAKFHGQVKTPAGV